MNTTVIFDAKHSPIFYHLRLWWQLRSRFYYWVMYTLEGLFAVFALMVIIQRFVRPLGMSDQVASILTFLVGVLIWVVMIDWFWRWYFKNLDFKVAADASSAVRSGEPINLADFMGFQAASVLVSAAHLAEKGRRREITPDDILAAAAALSSFRVIANRLGMTQWLGEAPLELSFRDAKLTPAGQKAVEAALNLAAAHNRPTVLAGDLIIGAVLNSGAASRELKERNLSFEDLSAVVAWQQRWDRALARKPFWEVPSYGGGIGRDWAAGYTRALDQYAIDLSQYFTAELQLQVVGHQAEIAAVERILGRSRVHNVLLVGEPGIGKKTIVNGFAQRIMLGNTVPALRYRHIFQLDLNRLIAGASTKGELEKRLVAVMDDATGAGNIILFIDSIERLSVTTEAGGIDASELLIPYLRETAIQVIATTTPEAYHSSIEPSPSFAAVFERVDVKEPSPAETVFILEEALPLIETNNQVVVTYPTLKEVVRLADRYIKDRPFPEKAIRLLDEVAVAGAARGVRLIESALVDEVAQQQLKVPLGEIKPAEKKKLINLEQLFHQRVIGQDKAIKSVADAMRRARAGVGSGKRPIGTFLFVGPTGVGKTETAKTLAVAYFGSERRMIRLDMSEFRDANSISRLLGGARIGRQLPPSGILTQAVIDHPFSLILLDEFEKAHPDVLNLFLQVFEDGRLTDSAGRVIDFTNTIIIATSNAGAEFIRQNLQAGPLPPDFDKQLIDYIQRQNIFKPELLNRLDAVVFYLPLTANELEEIIKLKIQEINLYLKTRRIEIKLSPQAITRLAGLGYTPELGARPLRRLLQEKVENVVARGLLDGTIKPGTIITIGPEMI